MRFAAARNRLAWRTMSLSRRALLLAAGAAPFGARAAEPAEIVCPLAAEPEMLIPGLSDALETRLLGSKVYGGLCRFDANGVPHPDLASGWDISADGLTYVFHLRPDTTWHDSGAVTGEDVAFSIGRFHRILQPRLGLGRVTAVRVPDRRTAVVTLAEPFEPFLRQMDAMSAPIVPQHVHDCPGFALDPRQVLPVGTGPFRVAEWLRLKRFDWFAGPKPGIAEIACPVVADPAARLALLDQPGALLVGPVDAAGLAEQRQNAALAWEAQATDEIAGLRLNRAVRPLDDARVRQGLAYAIDRAAVLRDAWLGWGRVASGPVLSGSPDRDAAVILPAYDPRVASGKFTEAGLRPDAGGVRLRLSHLVPPGEPWQRLAMRLRTTLQYAGVDLVPEAVTAAEWSRRVDAGEYETTGFIAQQTGDASLDLVAYAADLPEVGPLLAGPGGDARLGALAAAQAMLVSEAARIWLVEPAVPVVRDRRLRLPGGVFGSFAMASLASGSPPHSPEE